jgi:hypothetical protein
MAFSTGLRNGTLPPGMTAVAPTEVSRRFSVYRNNVATGLIDALAKRFPVIERLVGTEFFRAIAIIYAETHRPRSPVLSEWGETFAEFLGEFPNLQPYPYMVDVAQIEWARGVSYHASDAAPLTCSELVAAADAPSASRLRLHPSVQVLRLSHAGVSIWAANQPGVQPCRVAPTGPETALIFRNTRFKVPVCQIGAGDAALIEALLTGDYLEVAIGAAAQIQPGHEPHDVLISLMQAGALVTPARAMR